MHTASPGAAAAPTASLKVLASELMVLVAAVLALSFAVLLRQGLLRLQLLLCGVCVIGVLVCHCWSACQQRCLHAFVWLVGSEAAGFDDGCELFGWRACLL